jgi:hypothetical protein
LRAHEPQPAVAALEHKDTSALGAIDPRRLRGGTSEIRTWICAAGAVRKLAFGSLQCVAGRRSSALTGVGPCFAHWS